VEQRRTCEGAFGHCVTTRWARRQSGGHASTPVSMMATFGIDD
jgi:hypothetical protein